MQVEKNVWISRPDAVKQIDFQDAESIDINTSLVEKDCDMSSCGWVKLGDATVTYNNIRPVSAVTVDAVGKIDEAISELRAETELKINKFLQVKNELLCLEGPSA